jgi:hypothetical protein
MRALAAAAVLATGATAATNSQAFAAIWTPAPGSQPTLASHGHRGQTASGNLVVSVPPVPPRRDLRPLCEDLLSSHNPDAGANKHSHAEDSRTTRKAKGENDTVADLIAATGGTRAAATAWCQHYLHPNRRNQRSR